MSVISRGVRGHPRCSQSAATPRSAPAKNAAGTLCGMSDGSAVSRSLIDEGARVVGAARTITPELEQTGAHAVPADLSTAEGVRPYRQRARGAGRHRSAGEQRGRRRPGKPQLPRCRRHRMDPHVRHQRAQHRPRRSRGSAQPDRAPGSDRQRLIHSRPDALRLPGQLRLGQGGTHHAGQIPGRGVRSPRRTREHGVSRNGPHHRLSGHPTARSARWLPGPASALPTSSTRSWKPNTSRPDA
jgi:hypothetical protein